MECNYPESLISGFAFPNAVETKVAQGDKVVIHDTSMIRLKSVNELIPQSQFSIVKAGLPVETTVVGDAIPPELVKPFHSIEWNGEALVPVPNSKYLRPRSDDNPDSF